MTHSTYHGSGLSEGVVTIGLLAKYLVLMAYGFLALLVEIQTFVIVAGPLFAAGWAAGVSLFALIAAGGVLHTWSTGNDRIERWTIVALVLWFSAYGFALLYRSIYTGDWGSGPLSLIPLVVCFFPILRYYSLIRRGNSTRGAGA